jgi:sigma-B regulation protein RsbU (phosphoserine phosphatase)
LGPGGRTFESCRPDFCLLSVPRAIDDDFGQRTVSDYFLQIVNGPHTGEQYPLSKERTVIGRHPSCDVMIPESAVSRQHAAIMLPGQGSVSITLEDLGSRNGTFVNGDEVNGPRVLHVGDELSIGGQQLALCSLAMPHSDHHPAEATMFFDTGDESFVVSQVDLGSLSLGVAADRNATAKLNAARDLELAIGSSLDPALVPGRLVEGLCTIFPKAERAFVLLIDRESGKPVLRARKLRAERESGPLMLSRSLIEKVVRGRQAILSADAVGDARLNMNESILSCHIRSVMCAPIGRKDGEVLGVLQVDSREFSDGFQPDDLEVLASLAEQAARAIEQAIFHEERVKREKLRHDLELARQVQQGMLPKKPPDLPGYDIFDFYSPARQIGGDYYDYVPLPDGRVVVILADVSGKGVSAALVMASLASKVALAAATEKDAASAVARVNASFCSNAWDGRFATGMLCVIDPQTHQATLVNAGHLPLALRHADGSVELVGGDLGCLPLGWDPDATYHSLQFAIEPGATVVLYTDGISEAMDVESQIYDFHRLTAVLEGAGDCAEDTGRRIIADVERYTAGQVQSDDICLICIHRQA